MERGLPFTQSSHDFPCQIVLAVDAPWIAAGDKEKRRRPIDHDPPDVLGRPRPEPLLDLELKAGQIGHLAAELRRVVLPSTPLLESLARGAVSSVGHHHETT
jgi:hypothetical protein